MTPRPDDALPVLRLGDRAEALHAFLEQLVDEASSEASDASDDPSEGDGGWDGHQGLDAVIPYRLA